MHHSVFIRFRLLIVCFSLLLITAGVGLLIMPVPDSLLTPAARTVSVRLCCPGADARTFTETTIRPLTQQLQQMDGLAFSTASFNSDGTCNMTLMFNTAAAQNKVTDAVSDALRQQFSKDDQDTEYQVTDGPDNILCAVVAECKNGNCSSVDLSNWAQYKAKPQMEQAAGISVAEVLNRRQSVGRLWVKPDSMAAAAVTVQDIAATLNKQNIEALVSGDASSPCVSFSVTDADILNLVIKENESGKPIKINDVAIFEMGVDASRVNTIFVYDTIPPTQNAAAILVYYDKEVGLSAAAESLTPVLSEITQSLSGDITCRALPEPASVVQLRPEVSCCISLPFALALFSICFVLPAGMLMIVAWKSLRH